VPARKLRPIRIRQALLKVTSCHFFFSFFSPFLLPFFFSSTAAAIGSVDRCIRFSDPTLSTPPSPPLPSPPLRSFLLCLPPPLGHLPSALPHRARESAGSPGAPRRCARARVHVYTHTRARGWADEWQVVPGIPTAVPRSVGSLLSYSKCWRARREEKRRP